MNGETPGKSRVGCVRTMPIWVDEINQRLTMLDEFEVGELVIMQNADYWEEYDGVPAVVIGPNVTRYALDLLAMEWRFVHSYDVRLLADPPKYVFARHDQLRKLHDNLPGIGRERVRQKPVEELIEEGCAT